MIRLRALRVENVRRFGGEGVALENFTDGLNVFVEPNEAGKSTLFDALFALVFFRHRSSKKSVRSLQPYGGGGAHICADFECEGKLYRVEKRFLKRSMALVTDAESGDEVARADEAEEWIDRHLGAKAPAGSAAEFLWVRQGESSEMAEGGEVRAEALGGVVADEISVLTGGAALRGVAARCEEELGALLNKRGAPAGAYKDARDKERELARAAKGSAQALKAARKDVESRERKRAQLAQVAEEGRVSRGEKELAQAREGLETARAEERKIKGLTREVKLLARACDAAEKAAEDFAHECAEARAAKEAAKKATAEQREAARRHDRAVAEETRARARHGASESHLREAQAHLRAAQVAERRKGLGKQLAEAQTRLDKAEKARARLAKAQAKVKAAGVGNETLRKLDEIGERIARVKGQVEMQSTSVRVQYVKGAKRKVSIGGAELKDSQPEVLDGPTSVTMPGLGELAIVPGDAAGVEFLAASLADEQKKLSAALKAAGCQNVGEARRRAEERVRHEQEATREEATLEAHAGEGLDALRLQVAEFEQQAEAADARGEGVDAPTIEEATKEVDRRERERERANTLLERAQKKTQEEAVALAEAGKAVEAAQQAQAKAYERTGDGRGWAGKARRFQAAAEKAQAAHDEAAGALRSAKEKAEDVSMAKARLERARKAKRNRKEKANQLERDIAVLDDRLRQAHADAIDEEAAKAADRHEAAQARLREYEGEVAGLQRLQEALEAAQSDVKERFLAPVNKELNPLLRLLYGGGALSFDDETLTPEGFERNGVEEDIAALSGGTREQIAILTRLAFAKLLSRSGGDVPVILDDALIFSDDDRIERMFTALEAQTRELQIVVLSCRQRAFESLGGNILHLRPWDAAQGA